MNSLLETVKYFIKISIELTVLFIGISVIVALIFAYIPKEKLHTWLSRRGILGNIMAAVIGALTPFCACSTIPMTLGFIEARVPFGAVISFVVASPLLNPIILAILIQLLGLKVTLLYFVITFVAAIGFGTLMQALGMQKLVRHVRLKSGGHTDEMAGKKFWAKLGLSFKSAWHDFVSISPYLFIGVALGAAIYGYLPSDFIVKVAGPGNIFAPPIAAIVGVPMYIRAESAIPIGMALVDKGMSLGAVMALIIGGAGMAIPEMSMLAGIFKKRLVFYIVLVVFLTATIGGYIFDAIPNLH